eukprot:4275785-Pleurochrysis_carterae.AAC.1
MIGILATLTIATLSGERERPRERRMRKSVFSAAKRTKLFSSLLRKGRSFFLLCCEKDEALAFWLQQKVFTSRIRLRNRVGLTVFEFVCAGFAAVYTEAVLKQGVPICKVECLLAAVGYTHLLALIQMALASLLVIGVFALVLDMPVIVEKGLWAGFDRASCLAVCSSALGGLIVSAVLKYADSVLKGYATAASVIFTGLLSAALFGTELDGNFLVAAVIVTCSIVVYNTKAAI